MNKHFYNPDHIEAFLENKLSQAENIQFQTELEKDPLLKNEVDLQEDIIESLKSSRKMELKNRLNNIEVSLNPSYTGIKVAASIVLSGLIGWGIHSYMNNEIPSADITNPSTTEVTALADQPSDEKPESIIFKNEELTVSEKISSPVISEQNTKAITSAPSKKTTTVVTETIGKVESKPARTPQLIEQLETETFHSEDNFTIPEGKVAQITENRSGIDVSVDKNSDKQFHYKYHDNKLFLYGNFDSKTYEILELNTYNGKQVYLNVDDNYYLLKSNQLEAAPLNKITDKKLIGDLNKFSNK